MKSFLNALLAVVLVGCGRSHPQSKSSSGWPEVFHAEQIRLSGLPPVQAMIIYGKLTNANLEISPEVKFLSTGIYWTNHEDMTSPQVIAELEKVLRNQAGVVISHLDAAHIAVTYDASAAKTPSK